ncbi:hypothetical protein QBC40DRAFT_292249 [Triangularia verruculosa]|uniref:Uncharacterized protein n=1 Tax=Triangularia verruculosa TaxID=2587418 RepID=A0AAN6XUZ1_9PEZI|nr:hypothetical protein QBC40DRAFT_292249 [Triangularia verruculosa]
MVNTIGITTSPFKTTRAGNQHSGHGQRNQYINDVGFRQHHAYISGYATGQPDPYREANPVGQGYASGHTTGQANPYREANSFGQGHLHVPEHPNSHGSQYGHRHQVQAPEQATYRGGQAHEMLLLPQRIGPDRQLRLALSGLRFWHITTTAISPVQCHPPHHSQEWSQLRQHSNHQGMPLCRGSGPDHLALGARVNLILSRVPSTQLAAPLWTSHSSTHCFHFIKLQPLRRRQLPS